MNIPSYIINATSKNFYTKHNTNANNFKTKGRLFMHKIIEASFQSENEAQNAIDKLCENNYDIENIELLSSGKSLAWQTYENSCDKPLGSATGFLNNTGEVNEMPTSLKPAIYASASVVLDNLTRKDNVLGIDITQDNPSSCIENETYFTVRLKTDSEREDAAKDIFNKCGAKTVCDIKKTLL